MKNVTFADIEIEIKKIPVEKLSEVYSIIQTYSQISNDKPKRKVKSIEEPLMTIEKLNGCIQIEDLNDYPEIKKRKISSYTNYANTIDQDLLMQ